MSNVTFLFQDYEVRFVGTAENPEWIAADVCKALELKASRPMQFDDSATSKRVRF